MSIASPSTVKERIRVAYEADRGSREARDRDDRRRDDERARSDTMTVLAAIDDATNSAVTIPFVIDVMIRMAVDAVAMPHPKALEAGLRALNDAGWTNLELEVVQGVRMYGLQVSIRVGDPSRYPPMNDAQIESMANGMSAPKDLR